MSRSRLNLTFVIFIGVSFLFFFVSSSEACPPLKIEETRPAAGGPGDLVRLVGEGFCESSEAYLAWGFDGESGFVFHVQDKASESELQAEVGDTHARVDGPVVLWEAQIRTLPERVFAQGRYRTENASLFVPTRRDQGPNFEASAGSLPGFASEFVNGEIRLDFSAGENASMQSASMQSASMLSADDGQKPPPASETAISVVVVVETCPKSDSSSEKPDSIAAIYELLCIATGDLCRVDLVSLVSESASTVLSRWGIEVRAIDREIFVRHESPVCGGFLNVTAPNGFDFGPITAHGLGDSSPPRNFSMSVR